MVPLAGASRRVLPWALTRMVPVVGWPVTAMLPVMRAGCRPGATGTASCWPDWPGMAETEPRVAGTVAGLVWVAATRSAGAAALAAG